MTRVTRSDDRILDAINTICAKGEKLTIKNVVTAARPCDRTRVAELVREHKSRQQATPGSQASGRAPVPEPVAELLWQCMHGIASHYERLRQNESDLIRRTLDLMKDETDASQARLQRELDAERARTAELERELRTVHQTLERCEGSVTHAAAEVADLRAALREEQKYRAAAVRERNLLKQLKT